MGLGVELYDRDRGVAFRQGLGIFKDRKRHGPSSFALTQPLRVLHNGCQFLTE